MHRHIILYIWDHSCLLANSLYDIPPAPSLILLYHMWKGGFIMAEKSVFYHEKGVHFGLKSQSFIMKKGLFWAEKPMFFHKKGVIFKLENKDGYHFFQWVRELGPYLIIVKRVKGRVMVEEGSFWTEKSEFYHEKGVVWAEKSMFCHKKGSFSNWRTRMGTTFSSEWGSWGHTMKSVQSAIFAVILCDWTLSLICLSQVLYQVSALCRTGWLLYWYLFFFSTSKYVIHKKNMNGQKLCMKLKGKGLRLLWTLAKHDNWRSVYYRSHFRIVNGLLSKWSSVKKPHEIRSMTHNICVRT